MFAVLPLALVTNNAVMFVEKAVVLYISTDALTINGTLAFSAMVGTPVGVALKSMVTSWSDTI